MWPEWYALIRVAGTWRSEAFGILRRVAPVVCRVSRFRLRGTWGVKRAPISVPILAYKVRAVTRVWRAPSVAIELRSTQIELNFVSAGVDVHDRASDARYRRLVLFRTLCPEQMSP